ncbi:c-type cytochrome [Sinorhizobium medicae]|uniref:C-type cytochrome n=1 Tax=Sinorhizobium medicae TaxID=110321 RepID=A0A6G1WMW6_9HYPH|nr:c-type cytochrome [Sinorhizobium medicae]MDX0407472.1 c-type cytochrome [Sinorhizobium medicae]MDX0413236.1 c-type cytochrome [Sinorhizobium medicae]MDX0419402.1 c-type cytochrome [Sinorhizobium medicae]MDX0429754.1 c-type cytochrome [Sinorhizobium medicae]MDX0449872.1 c-type cytochrome [Sinorhizobium medicae]
MDLRNLHWTTIAKVAGLGTGLLIVLGAVFVWSGIYNVAASKDHLRITTWILTLIRERSIATHSFKIEVPALDDESKIRLGASHYEGGCVPCHNRPGEEINSIVKGMLPPPPNLLEIGKHRPPEEIFWIVKHGLKYTGMPAWTNVLRDDEVWALTAFLASLPATAGDYGELAGLSRGQGNAREEPANGRALNVCVRCHERDGMSTNGNRVPRLAGMPEAYLLRSLQEYAQGTRASGVMEPVADLLSEEAMRELAAHYQALPPVAGTAEPDPEQLRRGEAIARRGIVGQGVPACLSCHSGRQSQQFPVLAGQNAAYIEEQIRLWRRGGRIGTPYGRIMAAVAGALDEGQIEDVAAYLASLPPGRAPDAPLAEAGR